MIGTISRDMDFYLSLAKLKILTNQGFVPVLKIIFSVIDGIIANSHVKVNFK